MKKFYFGRLEFHYTVSDFTASDFILSISKARHFDSKFEDE